MKSPDTETRRRLAQLEPSQGFQALIDWLETNLRMAEVATSVLDDPVSLRRRQGAADALRFVLARLSENREVLRRLDTAPGT